MNVIIISSSNISGRVKLVGTCSERPLTSTGGGTVHHLPH